VTRGGRGSPVTPTGPQKVTKKRGNLYESDGAVLTDEEAFYKQPTPVGPRHSNRISKRKADSNADLPEKKRKK
jgi:hypothetical protein